MEVKAPIETTRIPEQMRYEPQVKSDLILQRRNLSLAPIEAADKYTRNGTNTLSWTVVGHQDLHQLLDPKSVYFSCQVKFEGGYPKEDLGMLFEEVIISSNGRTIERVRNAQYIQYFVQNMSLSRDAKMQRREEGFSRCEDQSWSDHNQNVAPAAATGGGVHSGNNDFGDSVKPLDMLD